MLYYGTLGWFCWYQANPRTTTQSITSDTWIYSNTQPSTVEATQQELHQQNFNVSTGHEKFRNKTQNKITKITKITKTKKQQKKTRDLSEKKPSKKNKAHQLRGTPFKTTEHIPFKTMIIRNYM